MLLLDTLTEKARSLYPQFFNAQGFVKPKKLIALDGNAKTVKGRKRGYATAIMYLAPSVESGLVNLCPMASEGCKAACLFTAGMGRFPNVKLSRLHRTIYYALNREAFMVQLVDELKVLERRATKLGLKLAVRLNGTSDIQWENITVNGLTVFEHFPQLQFYDYTKIARRMFANSKAHQVPNYHLTFSRSESNHQVALTVLTGGGNVAAVFAKAPPANYAGYGVIDGDKDDLRFLDQSNVIVGLKAKGKGRTDKSGFVIH